MHSYAQVRIEVTEDSEPTFYFHPIQGLHNFNYYLEYAYGWEHRPKPIAKYPAGYIDKKGVFKFTPEGARTPSKILSVATNEADLNGMFHDRWYDVHDITVSSSWRHRLNTERIRIEV